MNSKEYYDFINKFEARHTTDDCYTPPEIYDAVADYVANRYGFDKEKFMRPFYPGGDYEAENYTAESVVVDNPPFSMLANIIRTYLQRGVKFFLFAPSLTAISSTKGTCCVVACDASITYDNGAKVKTSFVTNLEPDLVAMASPELYKAIKTANEERQKAIKKQLPKYSYPNEVLMCAILNYMSAHETDFAVRKEDACFVRALDHQARNKKEMFGAGFLLSEKAAAEKAAAEKAAAEKAAAEKVNTVKWQLSERELAIIKNLGIKDE